MTHIADDHGLFDASLFTQISEGPELVFTVVTFNIELLRMEGGEKK